MTKIERFEDIGAWQEAMVSDEVARLISGFVKYLLSGEKHSKNPTNATNSTNSTNQVIDVVKSTKNRITKLRERR